MVRGDFLWSLIPTELDNVQCHKAQLISNCFLEHNDESLVLKRPPVNRAPFGCIGTGDSHLECSYHRSAAAVWYYQLSTWRSTLKTRAQPCYRVKTFHFKLLRYQFQPTADLLLFFIQTLFMPPSLSITFTLHVCCCWRLLTIRALHLTLTLGAHETSRCERKLVYLQLAYYSN